jgi:hypothetical protein
MKTICRFDIVPGLNFLHVPQGAAFLAPATKDGQPTIWALVDDAQPPEARLLYVAATGENLDGIKGSGICLGTVMTMVFVGEPEGGRSIPSQRTTLVFHVFDTTLTIPERGAQPPAKEDRKTLERTTRKVRTRRSTP